MPEISYVPFREFRPDLRLLANPGLVRARNVLPVYGDYITSPAAQEIAEIIADGQEFGLHVHRTTGDGYAAVNVPGAPALVHLYQVTEAGVVTDRSRAAFYANNNDFTGSSFGPYVVMTNYDNEVQFRDGGGAVAFANMITSAFLPRAKFSFAFPQRANLFLAHCNIPAPYDTIAAGANPQLVCWSQSDNIQAFGGQNLNPELTGCGFQQMNYDLGQITGAIAGSGYGIIALSDGFARVDGPPYVFRVVSDSCGCIHPYSLVSVKGDIWFWGPSGLTRLPGGENVPEVIGLGVFTRSLIDNATGFFEAPWQGNAKISMAYDSVNDLLFSAYRSPLSSNGWPQTYLTYNIGEGRATYSMSPVVLAGPDHRPMHFLRSSNQPALGAAWTPGGTIRFLTNTGLPVSYRKLVLGQLAAENQPILQKGYIQPKTGMTTRFLRIRPVYNVTNQAAIEQVSISIQSTNKPYKTPVSSGPFTLLDEHGFITTPGCANADFHSITFTMTCNAQMHTVVEWEGFEYEIADGPPYSA